MKKKGIAIILIVSTFLYGCEDLTYEEFKAKYDWAETECILEGAGNNFNCKFSFNGNTYNPFTSQNSVEYYHYWVLFDKQNPDKNFIVQRDKPVLPKTDIISNTYGIIKGVYKTTNFLFVEYKWKSNIEPKRFLSTTYVEGQRMIPAVDFLPVKYYEELMKLKQKETEINIDLYAKELNKDGSWTVDPFINRISLDSLLGMLK